MSEVHPDVFPSIAGYRVDELIGRGGMGVVYRATDIGLGRPVALKVLSDGVALDEGHRERLLAESRRAASLDHPHVVPVYEAGESAGRLFLAMRFVAGTDLKALLRREGALEPARAMAITAQVADALDAAHRRGLVHRDVKPGNVLLDHDDDREHAYLADFGLTQSTAEGGVADGHLMGTVDYVAPEQIRGEPLDGRADQYGLACLLFECLTGTLPYRCASDVAAIFAHLEEPVPSACARRVELPAAVDAIFERGMAKDPADRYATCTELVDAAREALDLGPAAPPARRPLVALLAAAAALVAAGLLAFALTRGGDAGAEPATGALLRVDPRSNAVVVRTAVPGHPGALAVTRGGVWMADFRAGVLWRQPAAGGPVERLTSNGEPRDLAVAGDKVYVGADGKFLSGVVSRYDAVTGVREDGIDLLACAMASGDGVVWSAGCPAVQRLSTDGGRLRKLADVFLPYQSPATVENSRAQFREMAIGDGSLWVLGDALDRRAWRLDERTGRILATIRLPFPPRSAAVAGGSLWITDGLDDTVVPVDTASNVVGAPVRVGRGPGGIAASGSTVWVANALDGTLSRLDAGSRRVVATVHVGGEPREVTVGGGSVWVTADAR